MKHLFLSAAFICITTGAQAATITLSGPSSATGSFDVDVDATDVFANFPDQGDALLAFGFNVTIGSPVVTLTGVTVNSVFFADISGCCVGTDVVALAAGFGLEQGDFVEPLLLATLHFSVTGVGPTTIGISGDNNADPNQGLVFVGGAENVSASQPFDASGTPEPATMLMTGIGITALALFAGRLLPAFDRRAARG